jgi:hypothetical protein
VKGIHGIRADGVIELRPTKNMGESTSGGDWYPEGTGILFYNCEIGRSSNGRILSQRGSSVTLQNCTLRSSITGWYVGSSGSTEGTLYLRENVTINCAGGISNTQTTPLGTVNIANNTYIYTPTTGVPNDIIRNVKKVFDDKISTLKGVYKEDMQKMKTLILQAFENINVADNLKIDLQNATPVENMIRVWMGFPAIGNSYGSLTALVEDSEGNLYTGIVRTNATGFAQYRNEIKRNTKIGLRVYLEPTNGVTGSIENWEIGEVIMGSAN